MLEAAWNAEWYLERWTLDQIEWAARRQHWLRRAAGLQATSVQMRKLGLVPDSITEFKGNPGLNEGLNAACLLIIGGSATAYNAANARIGVGNSTTAAVATQTDLQAAAGAANQQYNGMNSSYPSVSGQTISFQSDFATSVANFAWQEWTIDNGAAAHLNLNRKVTSYGTKPNTETWTLTATLTLA